MIKNEKVKHTMDCLGGWCQVGSTVYSDFYVAEAAMPRRVVKIHAFNDMQASVWTEKGDGMRALESVDFETWITEFPK